jgi:hypothetical protein
MLPNVLRRLPLSLLHCPQTSPPSNVVTGSHHEITCQSEPRPLGSGPDTVELLFHDGSLQAAPPARLLTPRLVPIIEAGLPDGQPPSFRETGMGEESPVSTGQHAG